MISIAICDDDTIYLDQYDSILKKYFNANYTNYEIIKFKSPDSLLFHLEDHPNRFHIYFIDIMMPKINGIETAKRIRKINPSSNIIFLTTTPDFVFEAFDAKPINYLLKDKDDKKLLSILDDFIKNQNKTTSKDSFICSKKNNFILIPNDEILYFEVFHRVITVHKIDKSTFNFYCSLKELEELIDENRFIKIYRSYIVNMQYIKKISYSELELFTGSFLPISRNFFNEVKDKFTRYLNSDL